jgi:uncharacterized protein YjiS (DUF1127 family)
LLIVVPRTAAPGVYAMSLLNLFILVGKPFSTWRRRERTYAELMALDDQTLTDIGITRQMLRQREMRL